jgi:hypothetical protein
MEYNTRFTIDTELENNFKELNNYIISSDYFLLMDEELKKKYRLRTDSIKHGKPIGDTGINILEVPARKVVKTTKQDYKITCPLCLNPQIDKNIYPYNLEKNLLWRGYMIKPNTFPYFKLHYLIQSTDHILDDRGTQKEVHKNPNIISDMLDYISIIKKGTILFNGYLGNSLEHLHFHYTDINLPIKSKLKKYFSNRKIITTPNGSSIYIYEDKDNQCKNFVLFKGKNISGDVFKMVQYLDSIKLLYNLIFYYRSNHFYIFVYIRKKEKDELNFNFGAAHLSGLGTFSDDNLKIFQKDKKYFIQLVEKYCSNTLIKLSIETIERLFH